LATFLVVVFATFFNNALHFYTRVQKYPLFARVGREEFVPFHKEYRRRLPIAIYAPYSLLMAANAPLFCGEPSARSAGPLSHGQANTQRKRGGGTPDPAERRTSGGRHGEQRPNRLPALPHARPVTIGTPHRDLRERTAS